jgi:hypothetical protein
VNVGTRYGLRVLRGLGFSFVAPLMLASMLSRGARAQDQDQAIVFIAPPGLSSELTDALDEAVSAQVSLVGARLVFLTAADDDAGLEERMSQAEVLARENNAAGVFWIDARPSRRWFLYIMDRTGAHVVVRPLSVEGASMDAAIEAAAVIAGSASDALLKQQSLEARLAAPPPAAPPPEAALRLEFGYSGTVFAPRVPWVSGLWIGASWLWPSGPYVGVSYVWSPPIRIVDEATFEVTRYPVWLQGGVRIEPLKQLAVGGELGLGLEIRTRTTTSGVPGLVSIDRKTRPTYLTSVRLVAEYRILDWLSILARLSPELTLNNFEYQKQPTGTGKTGLTYLSPYELRFTAQLGLAIIR